MAASTNYVITAPTLQLGPMGPVNAPATDTHGWVGTPAIVPIAIVLGVAAYLYFHRDKVTWGPARLVTVHEM